MSDQAADITTQTINVNLPANLLAQIDAQIGGGFVDREDFIRSAARHYLEYQQSLMRKGQDITNG